jgi:hypothetical protein
MVLPLRITVMHPPRGVTVRLQQGKAELVPPARILDESLSFDLTVKVIEQREEPPNFRGPFVQGPPAKRFVYINSGTRAGQVDSCWTRRAKVFLTGITWELIDRALAQPGTVLEARFTGTICDGGPACATVPLLENGWQVATAK